MNDLELAIIGNCSYAALIDAQARIVWACLPHFDGDPAFCSLLEPVGDNAEHGVFAIELVDFARSEQHYLANTAIVVTRLHDAHGAAIEITDFAPRFGNFGRNYRPMQLIRRIVPLAGKPRIRVVLRPLAQYGALRPGTTRGSNHIRYVLPDLTLRLTADAPISYIAQETPFIVEQEVNLVLGPDESLHESPNNIGREFLEKTTEYWRDWTRSLSIPFDWQREVIRAAITLKLSAFDETGGIVAAMTTSLPEAPNSGRNWDYRLCWLRDSYFVVRTLNRLGATRTMEHYLHFITNLIAAADGGDLQPVYGIATQAQLVESEVDTLAGYRGMGPVRVGNQAYEQIQNDSYGAVILALTQLFYDSRLDGRGTAELFEMLETLGDRAVALHDKPDAGLWELRNRAHVHTFSSMMCWAAADRLARIAGRLGLTERAAHWRGHADTIHATSCAQAWNTEKNCFVATFDNGELDAALLLMHEIGFLPADDPRFVGTVDAIGAVLRRGDYLFRYAAADDFGMPENAFNICTFWYIDALGAIGRTDEARALFENMLTRRNRAGLLSEDLDPVSGEQWGNFPQTYSMVGLINSAMRLSRDWDTAL
jgi:GH15 family glucan-1,4-alpha-glucosidase